MGEEAAKSQTKKSKPMEEERKSVPVPVENSAMLVFKHQPDNALLSPPSVSASFGDWMKYASTITESEKLTEPKLSKAQHFLKKEHSNTALILIGRPLDYSFRNFTDFIDLARLKPRSVRVRTMPARTPSGRYFTASIWASYNELRSMVGLDNFIHSLLERPEILTLLDLSFNQIKDVSEEITNFLHLKHLRLHSNRIDSFAGIAKLSSLEKLHFVTFKGNPIQRRNSYREIIIKLLPKIQSIDFSLVTTAERKQSQYLDADLLRKAARRQ